MIQECYAIFNLNGFKDGAVVSLDIYSINKVCLEYNKVFLENKDLLIDNFFNST